jgi:predicted SAM-dependent methyltransferase
MWRQGVGAAHATAWRADDSAGTSVVRAITDRLRHQQKIRRIRAAARRAPCRLVVGASGLGQQGWISTEIDTLNVLQPRDWQRLFVPGSIDAILAEHVWEHLTPEEGAVAARLCYRYLAPAGYLRLAVPDGCHPRREYIDYVRPGGTGPGADDHKVLYTYSSLGQMLRAIGFDVALLEYYDEQGEFQYVEWDPAGGMIRRSRRFDPRNAGGELAYTSLIIDARKPA